MIKLIITGRRRAGATRAKALHHLKTVHGPMVYDPPVDAGPMPAAYVQNHVFDGTHPGEGLGSLYAIDRDFVTEIWFEDLASLAAATSTPYYKSRLQTDENNFVDQATVAPGLFRATPRGVPEAGPFKLFVFVKAVPGVEPEKAAGAVLAHVKSDPVVQDAVLNTAVPRPGNEPFTHVILELWFAARGTAVDFAAAGGVLAAFPAGMLDPAACFYLLAEEFTVERMRAT